MKLNPGTRVLNVKLQSDDIMLSEVVVKPKKEKYSRKNNPAVEFMKKVIENKKALNWKRTTTISIRNMKR